MTKTSVYATATIAPHHLGHLAASGITPETAIKAGIRTITDREEARGLLAWHAGGQAPPVPGLWFPYGNQADGYEYGRYRPDEPRVIDDRPAKYEAPVATTSRIYMPRGVSAAIDEPTVELWVLEGEKKTLAHAQSGFAAVGVPGVWQFHDVVARAEAKADGGDMLRLHPDLASIIAPGRKVTVLFDADVDTNLDIVKALARATSLLTRAGAIVSVSYLPSVEASSW